jgi:hypothetical protein
MLIGIDQKLKVNVIMIGVLIEKLIHLVRLILLIVMIIKVVLQFEMNLLLLIDIEKLGFAHECMVENSLSFVIHVMMDIAGKMKEKMVKGNVYLIKLIEFV